MSDIRQISIQEILDYEVRSSWWSNLLGIECLRVLAARYFAWKTRRKYARYLYYKNAAISEATEYPA